MSAYVCTVHFVKAVQGKKPADFAALVEPGCKKGHAPSCTAQAYHVKKEKGQIDEAVKTDPSGSGYEDWRGNVSYLKRMIAQRYAETAAIRDSL